MNLGTAIVLSIAIICLTLVALALIAGKND